MTPSGDQLFLLAAANTDSKSCLLWL